MIGKMALERASGNVREVSRQGQAVGRLFRKKKTASVERAGVTTHVALAGGGSSSICVAWSVRFEMQGARLWCQRWRPSGSVEGWESRANSLSSLGKHWKTARSF